jgi:UDP-N-acetylglucosamine--N-acetylmuramyl-(pentapeptide) pyrophosphoryl-undecaprenol N-acetylglucosamine transferase
VSTRRYALVAGGGTGGHLVPALAVARALGEGRGPDAVELVGARRGLDAELLEGEGVPATLLPGRGIARHLDARSLVANAGAVAGLAVAFVAALVIVVRRRPSVVVAMGGYACVPTALAAALVGIPVVLVNVDAVPGAANRLVGRFARAAAVGYEGTALPRAVVTGVPVRAAIVEGAHPDARVRAAARDALGLPRDRLVVAAVGGSLGSKRLNQAVIGLARLWATRTDVALFHVVGRRDASWASADAAVPDASDVRHEAADTGGLCYVQVPYEDRMTLFYQAADIVVSRAGANTVAELAVVGVPAILVPLPGAPSDHQRANAGVLERAGAAVVVPDPECSAPRLAQEIDALASDPARLDAMRTAAGTLGRPDAVSAVVTLARAHARAPHGGALAAHAL